MGTMCARAHERKQASSFTFHLNDDQSIDRSLSHTVLRWFAPTAHSFSHAISFAPATLNKLQIIIYVCSFRRDKNVHIVFRVPLFFLFDDFFVFIVVVAVVIGFIYLLCFVNVIFGVFVCYLLVSSVGWILTIWWYLCLSKNSFRRIHFSIKNEIY